jgi:trans-aconitate methyltransferase
MTDLYDFATSYNSEALSNPSLYAKKGAAVRQMLVQLAKGEYSLYDNDYRKILIEQYPPDEETK